jgi:hypothetical protein
MQSAAPKPAVRLGETARDGISPGIFALVERGVERRRALAGDMRGRIELRFAEEFSPVRLSFAPNEVVVEDGSWEDPDLLVAGRLPDIVQLATAPLMGGIPNPVASSGRTALVGIARKRVTISGRRALARQLLQLLRL